MKRFLFLIFLSALLLVGCGNYNDNKINKTIDSEEETTEEKTYSTESTESYQNDAIKVPEKGKVNAVREKALEGMSDSDIEDLCYIIRSANEILESSSIYSNFFERLADPNDLYWNYFDKSGEIQIDWSYDGDINMRQVMKNENLTEDEFYNKYGQQVVAENKYSAEDFINIIKNQQNVVKNERMKADLQTLIDETQMALEHHDVEHAKKMYYILHDMDYFLLNYRLDEEAQDVVDKSTIGKYYGVLSVYED